MTERIDHAAEALKIMHDVSTDNRGPIPLELFDSYERWAYEVTMQEAQTHATLSLVEQQRIANLIAWVEVDEGNGVDARFKRNLYRANIKEALGLS